MISGHHHHRFGRQRWLGIAVDAGDLACEIFQATQASPGFGLVVEQALSCRRCLMVNVDDGGAGTVQQSHGRFP